jgi:serine/threonine protein kinase
MKALLTIILLMLKHEVYSISCEYLPDKTKNESFWLTHYLLDYEYFEMDFLGEGSWGRVTKAEKIGFPEENLVAYKTMAAELNEYKRFVKWFTAEMTALCTLKHPNIIETYEWGVRKNETHYEFIIISELAHGDYWDLMYDYQLEEIELLKAFHDFLEGMEFIHKKNFIHGDLKWNNVLYFDYQDELIVKIADFGFTAYFEEEGCPCPGPDSNATEFVYTKYCLRRPHDINDIGLMAEELMKYLPENCTETASFLKEYSITLTDSNPCSRPNATTSLVYFNQYYNKFLIDRDNLKQMNK